MVLIWGLTDTMIVTRLPWDAEYCRVDGAGYHTMLDTQDVTDARDVLIEALEEAIEYFDLGIGQ